jgi:site-specific recombinase XerD
MKNATILTPPSSFERLVNDLVAHMQSLGYSSRYLRLCCSIWRDFSLFLSASAIDELSEEVANRFLKKCGICIENNPVGRTSRQRLICAAIRILVEFNLHGCFQRRRCAAKNIRLTAAWQTIYQNYIEFCTDYLHCSPGTMRCRARHTIRFLHFLESTKVANPAIINPKHLSDFVGSQIHLKPKTVAVIVSDLRSFMRYLCMEGFLHRDLSSSVPKVRIPRDARIPSVWSRNDVEAILQAVDRHSPKGKRDYVILLLACRLGMRVSDIRNLRLDDIHWEEERIDFIQLKTKVPSALPLTEELGEALVDYLQNGRPVTSYRELFLRINAPIQPLSSNNNLHSIITFYRQRAGIKLPRQGSKGMHSLRHTVATRLLEAEIPLEIISNVMGHMTLESTQIYMKVDVEVLRSAALDLEVSDG